MKNWAGIAATGLILALLLGTLAAVWLRPEAGTGLGPADWAALRFTLMQAALSAVLSVGLAIPVARGLARRRFWGRSVLISLMGAPFILPIIVAVLGLLAVFGQNGLVNFLLKSAGLDTVSIYGLHGVVLGHVFFNLPLATRLILQGWQSIPGERFRLAGSLGMSARDVSRVLERPMLREVVPGALMVVFVICITSFAVALTLGGGPAATTVELAIYQAVRFDFDLNKAALLALMQFAIGAVAAVLAIWVRLPAVQGGGLDRISERWDKSSALIDTVIIGFAAVFLILPIGIVALKGIAGLAEVPSHVWGAMARSIVVSLSSVLLMLAMAIPMAVSAVRMGGLRGGFVETVGALSIASSPLVLGVGLFIILFPFVTPWQMALPVTAVVNAVLALPFALRALVPAVMESETRFGQLGASLGMSDAARFRLVTWPRMRGSVGFSCGLTAALSMGDLGVIALFADPGGGTLPLLMYRLMASYRMEAAAGVALILLALSVGMFFAFDRWGRRNALA